MFDPERLPVKNDTDSEHHKVQELMGLSTWSDEHVWVSPEQHGNLVSTFPLPFSPNDIAIAIKRQTAVFKNQIDWFPLSTGSIRPRQGRTLAIAQV